MDMISREFRLADLGISDELMRMVVQSDGSPTDKDTQVVQRSLLKYTDDLRLLDLEARKQSGCQEEVEDGVLYDKRVAEHRVFACRSITAAWRRIPLELWDVIFSMYMEAWNSTPTTERLAYPPGVVMLISQWWRSIITDIPSLWANLWISSMINYPKNSIQDCELVIPNHRFSGLLSHLDRIGSHPWSLALTANQPNTILDIPLEETTLRPFRECLHHSAFASLNKLSAFYGLQGLSVTASFPSVLSVLLVTQRLVTQDTIQFPNVKQAVVLNAVTYFYFPPSLLPWTQLTHLHLEFFHMGAFVISYVLFTCRSLQQASFKTYEEWPATSYPHTYALPIGETGTRPLSDLTINGITKPFQDEYPAFAKISFPCLSTIRYAGDELFPVHQANRHLVGGLRCLQMTTWLSNSGARSILEFFPSLTELHAPIEAQQLTSVSEYLALSLQQPTFPSLKILVLKGCHPRNTSDDLDLLRLHYLQPTNFIFLTSPPPTSSSTDLSTSTRPRRLEHFSFHVFVGSETPQTTISLFKQELDAFLRPHAEAWGTQLSVDVSRTEPPPEWEPRHWDEGLIDHIEDIAGLKL
ncbi:hypothetical protein DFP72DRAFT_7010 [Ephemerocybe angulata]|uniref:F-box domain-containing protein n=1 Tax=Ephemerocybe angulata TaxID=980116 RepID=A0A8H6ME74_9AGAR|nr:hypothetical protein DFP72DRAFT_7010 [Tulosesus angulatus]